LHFNSAVLPNIIKYDLPAYIGSIKQ